MALYALLASAITLLGWILRIQRLTDWVGSGITMFVNPAIAAGCAGAALWLLVSGYRRAAALLAVVVGLIGGATLIEHLTGLNLHIDTLLVRHPWENIAAAAPGRMGPPASLSFLLIGSGLFLLARPRPAIQATARRFGVALGLMTGCISLVSLVGYVYGVHQMYTLPRLTGIAMQTATVVFAIALGMVAAAPERQPMRTFMDTSHAVLLARRVLVLIIGVPLLLGALRISGQRAGWYDDAFGTALRTVVEIILLGGMLWAATAMLSSHERSLRQSEERLRSVLENSLDAAYRRDILAGRYDYLSPATSQVMGVSADWMRELPLDALLERIHPDDRDGFRDTITRGTGERQGRVEYRFRGDDGVYRWLADQFTVQVDAQGTPCYYSGIVRDVTERRRAEESVRASAEFMRRVLDNLFAFVGVCTPDGTLIEANRAPLQAAGIAPEEVLGKKFWDCFWWNHSAGVQEQLRDAIERANRGEVVRYDVPVRMAGDTRMWIDFQIAPLRDREGKITHLIPSAMDITARVQARQAAEAASRAKDQLLAVVSHELRTPLNPILAITSYLESPAGSANLTPELKQDVDTIRRNVEQEARLVDDLLNLTRLGQGKLLLHYEALDMHRLLERLSRQTEAALKDLDISLRLQLDASTHHLWADPSRLEQVIVNLLDNAQKFTGAGGVITVSTATLPSGRLRIQITDTGLGIDADVLPRLFAPFEQGEKTVTRRYGGLGLGLVIAKGIVDLHGGTIAVASEGRDRGTTVTLEFDALVTPPAMPEEARTVMAAAPAGASSDSPREAVASGAGNDPAAVNHEGCHRILLVEDHVDTLKVMSRLLRGLKYDIATASTVAEACALIECESFDLLLSDIGLPDGSGLDVMRNWQQRTARPGVALSGFGEDEDIRRSLDAGFVEHLVKPVNFQVLKKTIHRLGC
jgi:PAS domain S-box-containing protein